MMLDIPRHHEDSILWLAEQAPAIMDQPKVRAAIERVIDKRIARDYIRQRRNGRPRSTFRWNEAANAELMACVTRTDRHEFSRKWGVSISAMRYQRHRLKCNAANGGGEGV